MSRQKFTSKQLIVELLDFLKKSNKNSILVEEYIQQTQVRKWNKARIIALYKAVHETRALTINYFPVSKSDGTCQCLQVTRA